MSEILIELIHSLSKNEKGYIVKSFTNKNSLYRLMFTIISAQKKYDEKSVKNNFEGTYIGNNFFYAKNYLYHSILKSLISYRASKKGMQYYFASIDFFYEKGLYLNGEKMLKQVGQK